MQVAYTSLLALTNYITIINEVLEPIIPILLVRQQQHAKFVIRVRIQVLASLHVVVVVPLVIIKSQATQPAQYAFLVHTVTKLVN